MTWLRHKSHKVNDASCSSSAGGSHNFLIIDVSKAACEEAALGWARSAAALHPLLLLPVPGCRRAVVFTVNTDMCCDDAGGGERGAEEVSAPDGLALLLLGGGRGGWWLREMTLVLR